MEFVEVEGYLLEAVLMQTSRLPIQLKGHHYSTQLDKPHYCCSYSKFTIPSIIVGYLEDRHNYVPW